MKGKKGLRISGFKLEQRKNRIEHVPILFEFRFQNQKFEDFRVKYPIGYRIDFDKWNKQEQRVKKNNFNKDGVSYNIINKRIQELETELPKIYNDALSKDIEINTKYLVTELNNFIRVKENIPIKQTVKKDIKYFIDEYTKEKTENQEFSYTSMQKYNTLKKLLSEFRGQVFFNDVTSQFLQNFVKFLWDTKQINNVTNEKYLGSLKTFLYWATDKGYNYNLDFQKFRQSYKGNDTKTRQNNIVFLNWDELQKLYNFDFSKTPHLQRIRDIFCFCCFTSLRYSDIFNLKKSDVKTTQQGEKFIQFTTMKTDDPLEIDLNKFALAIYEKYKNIPNKENKLFPVPVNQVYNRELKDVCKAVGFNEKITLIDYIGNKRIEKTFEKHELITTHTARKTFITNALYLGIQPDIIRSWTGHKDHKTMESYIKIVQEKKRSEMDKFNNR